MIAKLKIYINSEDIDITYHITSLLHGVIMENISTEYADELHNNQLNPYSQYLTKDNNQWCWVVSAVGKEAIENIINVLNNASFSSFRLKHKNNALITIVKKELNTVSINELTSISIDDTKTIKINFSSPTAFKSNGIYINFPDVYLIYNSLIKKISKFVSSVSVNDEETMQQLVESTRISSYNLKTASFNLEGRKITGFVGTITLYIKGPSIMKSYAKMLFKFGEYLGIGIKASLGMGAINILENKGGNI